MGRGTNLCPPELNFFNQAPAEPDPSSGEEEEEEKPKKKKQQPLPSKPLPESVKALKKKYTEQRIARTVITQKMDKMEKAKKAIDKVNLRDHRTKKETSANKPTISNISVRPTRSQLSLRRGLRSSRASRTSTM